MNCLEFRAAFAPSSEDPGFLEHVRVCDPCLDYAAHNDPDIMFRAIGGAEMIPPGGIDAFVSDVMHAVQLRKAEDELAPRRAAISLPIQWTRRLAVAATLIAGITGGALVYEREHSPAPLAHALIAQHSPLIARNLVTKPVVATYSSKNATIVEVPADSGNEPQVVMIVDENLPADL
jgi:hypothetical protein